MGLLIVDPNDYAELKARHDELLDKYVKLKYIMTRIANPEHDCKSNLESCSWHCARCNYPQHIAIQAIGEY